MQLEGATCNVISKTDLSENCRITPSKKVLSIYNIGISDRNDRKTFTFDKSQGQRRIRGRLCYRKQTVQTTVSTKTRSANEPVETAL